ncbi:MAG: UrcA family protein [Croceibacterium sp.]
MIFRFAMMAAALGAAALTAPAAAESVGIRHADLDLATPAGVQMLDRRIDSAARELCGIGDLRTGTRLQSSASKQCYQNAKANAHKQVAERVGPGGAEG